MFRTKIDIQPSDYKIDYQHKLMTFGSCFSDNIGSKLEKAFFDVDINPFGVLFNPVSIANSLDILLGGKLFDANDIFSYGNMWHSFSHSNLFSATDKTTCLSGINKRLDDAFPSFNNADVLLITFGTAWVYENVESGKVVSNCHKIPAKHFIRRKLSVNEIVALWTALIQKLIRIRPEIKLIFTVSPIRHWKDGAHENNISKSTLLLSIAELQQIFSETIYFPAYEIQLDELRDYRFYAADMLHPSEVAVDYIWERFSETFFNDDTILLKNKLERFSTQLLHRPIHPDSDDYKKFIENRDHTAAKLIQEYPFLAERIHKKSIL